jgi:hypothetical protein
MDYNWEVFISYNRQRATRTWVREFFYDKFKEWLNVELGIRDSRIFWDDHDVEVGGYWKRDILSALVTSRCILPIWTRGYFNSCWCVAEWKTFCLRQRQQKVGLIVPIQWQQGNFLPEDAREQTPANFWEYATNAPAFLNSALYMEYEHDLRSVCQKVAERIEAAPAFDENWPFVDPDTFEVAHVDELTNDWDITLAKPEKASLPS